MLVHNKFDFISNSNRVTQIFRPLSTPSTRNIPEKPAMDYQSKAVKCNFIHFITSLEFRIYILFMNLNGRKFLVLTFTHYTSHHSATDNRNFPPHQKKKKKKTLTFNWIKWYGKVVQLSYNKLTCCHYCYYYCLSWPCSRIYLIGAQNNNEFWSMSLTYGLLWLTFSLKLFNIVI